MERIVKIKFKPGEKSQLCEIIKSSPTQSSAKLRVAEEMKVDAITANAAVDRFWNGLKQQKQ